jgi:hypothetical protein
MQLKRGQDLAIWRTSPEGVSFGHLARLRDRQNTAELLDQAFQSGAVRQTCLPNELLRQPAICSGSRRTQFDLLAEPTAPEDPRVDAIDGATASKSQFEQWRADAGTCRDSRLDVQ